MTALAQTLPAADPAEAQAPLDTAPLAAAPIRTDPYPHVVVSGCLKPAALPALRRDFPRLERPGYHPLDTFTPVGAFAALLAQIEAGALEQALGDRLGGVRLADFPRMVTIHYTAAGREGRPHTDSERKVATLLIYMNEHWPSKEGKIRVLRDATLDTTVTEVPPEEGNIFAFLRTDNSWHGHTPFHGERRVVQVTWLRDAEAAERKRKVGLFNWRLKGLFGGGR